MELAPQRWAFIFPGQGAQSVGMGKALAEARPEAMAVWDEAEKSLRIGLKDIAWNGPEETLTRTDNAQPALLTASVAALRVVERLGFSPRAAAGHSAGEYAALVAAGSLKFSDALSLIRTRGQAMQTAAEVAGGGMAAVLGAEPRTLEILCAEIGGVAPANMNSPGQVVVSGTMDALAALEFRIKETGAKRFVRLNVAGPFHSPAMAPAARAVEDALHGIAVQDPMSPVYANVTAAQERTASEVKTNLIAQITGRVRWDETVRNMMADGCTHFLELGPGAVLTGLVKRVSGEVVAFSVGDPDALATFQQAVAA